MINHIVFDVDGTLTDGGIILSSEKTESKRFHVRDGQIIVLLPELGFTTMFLTGRASALTQKRAEELKVNVVLQGIANKKEALSKYMNDHSLIGDKFAYVGDDLNDYAAMQLCAFKACPSDASKEICMLCNFVSTKPGGYGAVREICEHLLHLQGKHDKFLAMF